MSHKSHAEIMGTVPIDVGDTPGHPAGVKGITDTENVTGPIHNRSLDSLIKNLDEHDLALRREVSVPKYEDKTAAGGGDANVDLSGRIYCGESTADDSPGNIWRFFRITDRHNNPLFVNGNPVVVSSVLDADGSAVIGVQRQISLSASGDVTFELQKITHVDVAAPLTYGQPGDLIVVAGGTPNDGTYTLEEVVSALVGRVRTQTGVDPAFTAGTFTGTVQLKTNGFFMHKADAGETYDVRLVLSETIPASTEYRVHYFVGVRQKVAERAFSSNIRREDRNLVLGMQQIYENQFSANVERLPGTLGDLVISPTRGEIVGKKSQNAEGAFGGTLWVNGLIGSTSSRSAGIIHTYQGADVPVGRVSAEYRSTPGSLSIESAKANKISDLAVQSTAANDLSDVGSGIVQSATRNFTADGVTVGMGLYKAGDAQLYVVTEVAPGADNARLRLDPAPGAFSNVTFTVYSRKWHSYNDPILYPGVLGIIKATLPTGTGVVTKGSDILTDATKNFTTAGVQVGDRVYFTGSTLNSRKYYTVAAVSPGGDTTQLQLNANIIEADATAAYQILEPTLLSGRACYIKDFLAHELTVQMLNGVSGSWPTDRTGIISIELYDLSVLEDNIVDDGSTAWLGSQSCLSVPIHTRSGQSAPYPGIHVRPAIDSSDSAVAAYKQDHVMRPADLTKGLEVFAASSPWLHVGQAADNYADTMGLAIGDKIYPLEGTQRLTGFTITEVSGPLVKVTPTPTFTTVNTRPLPFYVERAACTKITMEGKLTARELSVAQVERTYPLPVANYQGHGGIAALGSYAGFYTNQISWFAEASLDLRDGDVLQRIITRVVLDSGAVSNPNTVLTDAFITQRLDNNDAFAAHTLAAPYLASVGCNLTANSRIVTGLSGLSGVVYPGCYLILSGTGAWEIAHVINDTTLVLAEDHGQGTSTPTVTITNGFPTDLTLPSLLWVFVSILTTPYTYSQATPAMNYYSLGGPNNSDIIIGSQYVARTNRMI